jgi:hypothetical protein
MVSGWDLIRFYFIGLGAMGTLIGLLMLFGLFLVVWRENKHSQRRNSKAGDISQTVELNQIQRRIREEQKQQRTEHQPQETTLQAELLSQVQEQIRQTELLSQVQEQIRQSESLRREQERIRQADLLSQQQEQERIRQADLLSQVQERIRQADLLRRETQAKIDLAAKIKQEQDRNQQVELLIKQAKYAIAQDSEVYNPFDTDLLLAAIEYYHQSYLLINKDSYLQSIDSLQIEIDRRQEFKSLFRTATKYFHDKYFGEALATLFLAQALYSPPQLVKTIAECEDLARNEKVYLKSLDEAQKLSHAGNFNDALNIIALAATKFPRQDGADLQVKLNRVIAATEQLDLGNTQAKSGDINAAKYHYAAALHLMPEWKEPQLKLAMIEAQTGETSAAIDRLATVNNSQTKCLEGLLYSKKGRYQQAKEIWSKLNRDFVREYWHLISNETIEQCKLIQPQIKQLVDRGELEQARTISLKFIDQFGSDSLIETNLNNCILPGIEAKIWQTEDWPKIAILAHENWLHQPNIKSLHNWTIALYYTSQIDDNLDDLIIAWPTAIANISLDPSLQDIPWLGEKLPSLNDLSDRLWQILDRRIEEIKDSDLPKYLNLRDCYRREFWAMELAQDQPDTKMMLGELVILPACFQHYYSQFSLGEELKVWKTLYTKWGKAVAACLAGDPDRAEIIKTDLAINSKLEEFASQFVLYKQGYYYIQQENWRKAIYPLNDAKLTIRDNYQWHDPIDQLCTNHRLKIIDFEEHLDFSRFWHDLLPSNQSESYFVEYQALKIQLDWCNSLIPDAESLAKIKDLLYYYPLHPIAQAMFTQINDHWLQSNQ